MLQFRKNDLLYDVRKSCKTQFDPGRYTIFDLNWSKGCKSIFENRIGSKITQTLSGSITDSESPSAQATFTTGYMCVKCSNFLSPIKNVRMSNRKTEHSITDNNNNNELRFLFLFHYLLI